jgi:protein-disulfide isomerase
MAGELNSIGPKDAKVTIVEFADLQCSACQTHSPMVKGFAQEYPDKVRLVFRHFPLDKKHQWAMPAAAVAEYAAEKGKFWDFIREVMALNRELEGPDELYAIAKTVGLNVEDLQKRMTNPEDKAYKDVVKDMNLAGELGIVYTPTFFIVSDGGNSVEVTTSKDVLETLNSPKYKKIING